MSRTGWIIIIIVLLLLVGGFFGYKAMMPAANQTPVVSENTTPSPAMTESPMMNTTMESSQSASESAMTGAGQVREVTVEGSSFKFAPNQITVNKGDKVKVTFKNVGGVHDFVLPDFNVKT